MASRAWHHMQVLAPGLKLLVGTFTTDGSGDPTETVDHGSGYVVDRTGAGVYRIRLGHATTDLDRYASRLVSAWVTPLKATADPMKLTIKSEHPDEATPYVEIHSTLPALNSTALTLTTTNRLRTAGLMPHEAATTGVVTADAYDATTGMALANSIATFVAAHDDDVAAHVAADAGTCDVAAAAATTPATWLTLLTELYGDWMTHANNGIGGMIHMGVDSYANELLTVLGGLASGAAVKRVPFSTGSIINPIAPELISIVADVLLANGAQIIAAQPDTPRTLQIRVTDADASITAGTVTIVGEALDGSALTEVHSLVTGTLTIQSTYAYAYVTSVTVADLAGNAAGDNIGVGVGGGLALPVPMGSAGIDVTHVAIDGAYEAVAGGGISQNGHYTPTSAPNAARDFMITGCCTASLDDLIVATNLLKHAINRSVAGSIEPLVTAGALTSAALTAAASNYISGEIMFGLVVRSGGT